MTETAAPEPVASLRGAGRTFDDFVALADVDLTIARGSIVGVIGPSGAGKTTAIRLLTGALRPTTGEVEVLGLDPTRLPAATRARIGFMPQHVSLYDDLTVTENLDFVASLYGLFLFRRRSRIRALLDWLELTDARRRRARDLSGGMRRRLQLACALVHDPELVFLDEPTAGIDPLVRQGIWRELHRLREAGRTLMVTTQYVAEAEECDRVALIAEGRLIAFASPEDLRRRAFGGQLLELETSAPLDPERLRADVSADDVRRLGARRLQVLSQDASSLAPAVLAAAEAQGATVTAIHEARPSFDEVFALLVRNGRHAPEDGGQDATHDEAERPIEALAEPVGAVEPVEPVEPAYEAPATTAPTSTEALPDRDREEAGVR
jgi:ABC-2 type transport system ATP-binding protein